MIMRKIFYATALITIIIGLVLSSGCSTVTGNASTKILRQTSLNPNWQVYQIEVTVSAGKQLPIILQLNNGDKVDGYYYVEKGDTGIGFTIRGNTQFFESNTTTMSGKTPVSDRFSFTATPDQGSAYTVNLTDTATSKTNSTVFLELIYPGTGAPFIPIK